MYINRYQENNYQKQCSESAPLFILLGAQSLDPVTAYTPRPLFLSVGNPVQAIIFIPEKRFTSKQPDTEETILKKQEVRKAYLEKLQERDIDIEDSVRVEEQWDKVEKAMIEVATIVCGITKGKCRQRETWWWCDEVEKAVETKRQKFKEWKKAEECEKDVKQARVQGIEK